MIRVDDFQKQLPGLLSCPSEGREFSTLSGFILHTLGHIPATGERFDTGSTSIEIVDLDGSRIDKVIVSRLDAPQQD